MTAYTITEGSPVTGSSLTRSTADSDTGITRSAVLGPNGAWIPLVTSASSRTQRDLAKVAGTDVYGEAVLGFDVTATRSNIVLYYSLGSEGTPVPRAQPPGGRADTGSAEHPRSTAPSAPTSPAQTYDAARQQVSNAAYYGHVSRTHPGQIPVEFQRLHLPPCPAGASVAGQKVHVRVAIADAQDGQLDSTVLLRTQGLGFTISSRPPTCNAKAGACDIPSNGKRFQREQ